MTTEYSVLGWKGQRWSTMRMVLLAYEVTVLGKKHMSAKFKTGSVIICNK